MKRYVPHTERHGGEQREYTPSFTLDREVARARERMGPARWRQLNAEWSDAEGRAL